MITHSVCAAIEQRQGPVITTVPYPKNITSHNPATPAITNVTGPELLAHNLIAIVPHLAIIIYPPLANIAVVVDFAVLDIAKKPMVFGIVDATIVIYASLKIEAVTV